MALSDKLNELESLRSKVQRMETELAEEVAARPFQPKGFYTVYYATTGFFLGGLAAITSLLLNVVGSLLVKQTPMQLIHVYLTFPLGDRAMEFTAAEDGLVLAIGCCLYIGTGMLLGIPFYLVLARWTPSASLFVRLVVVSILALAVWLINFYGILSWLQPALIEMSEEYLIVNQIPPWVAALTHLVFGWTMAVVYPLGQFTPYTRVSEQS